MDFPLSVTKLILATIPLWGQSVAGVPGGPCRRPNIDEIRAADLLGDYPAVRPLDRQNAEALRRRFDLQVE